MQHGRDDGRPTTVLRLLTLLEVLQARGLVAGPVLADRLGVDERTLRRDVARLQRLGIPVEAERGRFGGYRLRPGLRLPPLMLAEEEMLAVTLGLMAVRQLGLAPAAPALEGALAKLARVLPLHLREQVAALEASVGFLAEPVGGTPPAVAAVLTLSSAIHRRRRVRACYRDRDGCETRRTLEPYGLAVHAGRWYLAARDVGRDDIRVFRLDRVLEADALDEGFEHPEGFDAATHITERLAAVPWGWEVEVLLDLPLASARRRVPPMHGSVTGTPEGTLLRLGAARLDGAARFLVGLDCGFRVLRPPELRDELRRLGEALVAGAGSCSVDAAPPGPRRND